MGFAAVKDWVHGEKSPLKAGPVEGPPPWSPLCQQWVRWMVCSFDSFVCFE